MKKIYLKLLVIMMTVWFSGSHAQVGIGTIAPMGALDITSTNDGLLVPRVALTDAITTTVDRKSVV